MSGKRVAIAGGGISGLAAAYYLGQSGVETWLFEPSDRLGGVIRTDRLHGSLAEGGPDSWLAEKAWLLDLVREVGLGDQVIGSRDARRRTYIVRRGRLVPLPASMRLLAPTKPWQLVSTRLFSSAAKLRMAREWLRRPSEHPERSVAEFVQDHFGDEALEYLAQPLLAGVYGSPPERLSAQEVIPRFVEYERRYGSILRGAFRDRRRKARAPLFLSLRDGMESLVEALQRRLATMCKFERSRVRSVRRVDAGWSVHTRTGSLTVDHVVLAVPAHEAGRLLSSADADLAKLLGGIPYTSSIAAALTYGEAEFSRSLDGFGLLAPRAEDPVLAACTWVNAKFAHRAAPGAILLRAFLAGASAERRLSAADADILDAAHAELQGWMRFRGTPTGGAIHRWARAMPQYGVGHSRRVREIEARARLQPGLQLAGNGYTGLGIPDCVRRSQAIAHAVAAG